MVRKWYDCHLSEFKAHAKMTSDVGIVGPIYDGYDSLLGFDYESALASAGFREFQCFICDFDKFSLGKNELRIYLNNCYAYCANTLQYLSNFKFHIIPIVSTPLSHYIPELLDKSVNITKDRFRINGLIRICTLKLINHGIMMNLEETEVNSESEFQDFDC